MTTVTLPNGNRAIELRSGDVVDPVFVSLSNLVRMGDSTFDQIIEWLSEQRAERANEIAKHEARVRQIAVETTARLEAVRAANQEHDSQLATLGDLR